ncbi:MAG: sensor histidine kinase, partial [Planctomycetia bacterium]
PSYFAALERRDAIVADDAVVDSRTSEFAEVYLAKNDITAMLDVPILIDGRLQGVVCCEQVGPPQPWTVEDRSFGMAVSNLIAVALAQAERRKAEEESIRAKDAAEAANRAKSEFLANVSHELRTPMNGILGVVELLQEDERDRMKRERLHIVKSSADSLLAIINELLDFSRIESGCFFVEPQPFALTRMLADTAKAASVRARRKGLDFLFDVAPDVPAEIVGDAIRLRQVLTNLLDNAVKFTAVGEVVFRVERVDARVFGELRPGVVQLRFEVADTGVGIAQEKQAVVFEPFIQADMSTTRKFGGTGLGLTISSRLVELMGGFVALRSGVGDGSCFSFELEFPADDSHDREVDELRRRLEGRRVLLTSRSNPLREMIARRLTANGLVAVAADSSNDPASYEVVVADAEEAPDPSRPPTPRVALEDPFTGVVETSTAAVGLQQPFLGIDLIRALDAAVNVATNRAEEAVAPASTIESDWSAMNVLLVEDNPVNQLVAAD